MTDRPAKRRRKVLKLTEFMDEIPPDVVVSHILPHIVIGVDIYTRSSDLIGPLAKTVGCFGRFNRDPLRHPWAVFRSFNVGLGLFYAARFPSAWIRVGKRYMILPWRYIVLFTLPRIVYVQDRDIAMQGFELPNLETVSSILLVDPLDSNKLYRRATTVIVQCWMDKIPNWCETLKLANGNQWDAPWRSEIFAATWVSKIGEHPCFRLKNAIIKIRLPRGYFEVVWDMRNVPNLEKFVIAHGFWIPLKPRYRAILDQDGDSCPESVDYDFLKPLHHLKELVLRMFLPVVYNRHWFLPPVEKRIFVAGFRVRAGFVIPPKANFKSCQWDPTCVYTVRPGSRNVLKINQNRKYDAPASVYEATTLSRDVERHLPGRTTIRGALYKLKYSALNFSLISYSSRPTKKQEAVIRRLLGLPFEFMFIGNIHKARLSSSPVRRDIPFPSNRIVLGGKVDKVSLIDSESLELRVTKVANLDVNMSDSCRITTDDSIDVATLARAAVELTAPYIDRLNVHLGGIGLKVISDVNLLIIPSLRHDAEFVGNIDKVHVAECDKMVTITGDVGELSSVNTSGTIAVTGYVGHASLSGPELLYDCTHVNFGRVGTLDISPCFVDIMIDDIDSIESVVFGSVRAKQIEFHGKRIEGRKLRFNGTKPREIEKIKDKISL